jgi:hypothetical protein
MIDAPHPDVVALRRDRSGRFALFLRTNLPPRSALPWWLARLDHGGDKPRAIRVRLDQHAGRDECWTARDLAHVLALRQQAEAKRRPGSMALQSAYHLLELIKVLDARSGSPAPPAILLLPGATPSPYAWTVAALADQEDNRIFLCPDPLSHEEGVSPELLLHVLEQILADAALAFPADAVLSLASSHATTALRCEVARLARPRRGPQL